MFRGFSFANARLERENHFCIINGRCLYEGSRRRGRFCNPVTATLAIRCPAHKMLGEVQ